MNSKYNEFKETKTRYKQTVNRQRQRKNTESSKREATCHIQGIDLKELWPQSKEVLRATCSSTTSKGLKESYNNTVEERREECLEVAVTKHPTCGFLDKVYTIWWSKTTSLWKFNALNLVVLPCTSKRKFNSLLRKAS